MLLGHLQSLIKLFWVAYWNGASLPLAVFELLQLTYQLPLPLFSAHGLVVIPGERVLSPCVPVLLFASALSLAQLLSDSAVPQE